MQADHDEMAGDSGSNKKRGKRGSIISTESKYGTQFSKKILTKEDDLSEDSGSRRAEIDTPSGLRTSRSRRLEDDRFPEKEELAKMAKAFGHTQQKKKPHQIDLNEDLLYGKRVNENTVRFDEICSIPLTNLISKFLRDLVAAGKTFSLELKLDDTPDDIAQVGNLLKESRFAHKYSDRLSIRNQDDHVRSEFNHLRSTIQSKSAFGGSTTQKQHQRLVVEEYQKIPESKRTEIENILHRTKARDSVKILDSKTYSVNPSVMGSPCRSQYGSISHMATHVVEEPYTKKPSSFNAYKNGQPTTVINQNAHQRLRQID